ncbi:MAG: hypothetical protein RLZZ127_195 [Planctomycetota bacterium]|jgi:hypothetical protein
MPAPASRPAYSADALELDAAPAAPAADSRLDGLIQRTSVEELARSGKRNLKTVSERSLRELIRQLVADAIARHADSMAESDRAQVLASVQGDLKQTLAAHQAEAAKRQALADRVAELEAALAGRDADAARIASLEAAVTGHGQDAARAARLESELATMKVRLETASDIAAELTTRNQELEGELAAVPAPVAIRDHGAELLVDAVLEIDAERFGGSHLAAAEAAGRGGDIRRAAALDTIGAAGHRLAELEEALAAAGVRIG